jgi:hypothetical protein
MTKHWIQGAIKHPGAEKKAAARAGVSTHDYMEKHKHDSGKAGSRARLGLTLSKMRKEDIDTVITSAFDNKPTEFLQAFSNIMADKMIERVAARKLEVAQNIYKPEDVAAAEKELEDNTPSEEEPTEEGEVVKFPDQTGVRKDKTFWSSPEEYAKDKANKGKILPFKKKEK